ncbi:DUF3899 domain-containing protein [Sporolactobacillus shoreae]|uniref:DUF3899 domain-containing protein n=1 Tax=Sporolactobacillus shoreae TaxID=1465501 RepID=UPI001F4F93C2|nr:DUF3899 domain-containing protein [Sporolactobacillus shoreae]
MKKKKNRLICWIFVGGAEFLISFATMLIRNHQLSLFGFADSIGLISLIFMTAGLILFIIQGGFFDGIAYSFRRFARAVRKKQLGDVDAEAPMAEFKIRDGSRWSITWPLLFVSLALFGLSLLLSLFL